MVKYLNILISSTQTLASQRVSDRFREASDQRGSALYPQVNHHVYHALDLFVTRTPKAAVTQTTRHIAKSNPHP